MTPDQEKTLARLRKLLAMAARRDGNEHEADSASRRLWEMLDKHGLSLRYLVGAGAQVKLIPAHLVNSPHAKSVLQDITARRKNVFLETHRVKDDDGRKAISKGFFAFERHGYAVFVRLRDVQLFF